MGKDGSAEKPFQDETQSHVYLEACKSRQWEMSVFAESPVERAKPYS